MWFQLPWVFISWYLCMADILASDIQTFVFWKSQNFSFVPKKTYQVLSYTCTVSEKLQSNKWTAMGYYCVVPSMKLIEKGKICDFGIFLTFATGLKCARQFSRKFIRITKTGICIIYHVCSRNPRTVMSSITVITAKYS